MMDACWPALQNGDGRLVISKEESTFDSRRRLGVVIYSKNRKREVPAATLARKPLVGSFGGSFIPGGTIKFDGCYLETANTSVVAGQQWEQGGC